MPARARGSRIPAGNSHTDHGAQQAIFTDFSDGPKRKAAVCAGSGERVEQERSPAVLTTQERNFADMKSIRCAVDRLEKSAGGDLLAVLIADEDEAEYILPAARFSLRAGQVVELTLDAEGQPVACAEVPGEEEARRQRNASRLEALFRRGKKN